MSIPLVDETLIEAVRGQKILYEKSHPKYHDNGAKSKAWKKIADDCFEGSILIYFLSYPFSYANIDAARARKRWETMLRTYRTNRAKLPAKRPTGSSLEDFGVTWVLFESLTWLDPYIKERDG